MFTTNSYETDVSYCLISDRFSKHKPYLPVSIVLEKNLKTRRKVSISKVAQIKKKTKKSMFHFATTTKNKILLSSQRSNKKSTKQMMVGSRNTNNYRLMRLLAARSQPKKLHFESDLSGLFSTTYHSKFENRNFVNKRTKVSINFSPVLNPET